VGGTSQINPPRLTLPVVLQIGNLTSNLHVLVDSGAEQNLLDTSLINQLNIPLEPLTSPINVTALNGQILTTITHETKTLSLVVSSNHHESVKFFIFPVLNTPLILSYLLA